MKALLVVSSLFFSSTLWAFPQLNLRFHCKNDNTGTLVQISLNNISHNKWSGNLMETLGPDVVHAIGNVTGEFREETTRMDLANSGTVFAVLSQTGSNKATYRDAHGILNCRF